MDIPADNQQTTVSDDQELAKALAGITQDADAAQDTPAVAPVVEPPATDTPAVDTPAIDPPVVDESPIMDYQDMNSPSVAPPAPADPITPADATPADPALASVKQAALSELRPLIDKLDVDPEEKFNTYLLIIRSTDDKDLIAPAHEAAKNITDETKKAQALLDIIKEIDFLSHPQQ